MDRFDRIYSLHTILQSARHPVPMKRLMEQLECSRATVSRVIEDSRDFLNAPLEYDRNQNGYFYNQAGEHLYELPGLWFNDSELSALITVQELLANVQPGLLDSHLAPLRQRIESLLQHHHAGSPEVSRRIKILRMAARPAGPWFRIIAGAVLKGRQLQLVYYVRGRDEETERRLSPQRLSFYRDNWYLDAWCHLRKALRSFSLDCVRKATVLERAAQEVECQQLEAHFAGSYGIFGGQASQTAVLRFSQTCARWVSQEVWHAEQQGHFLEDGRYQVSLPYHDPTELIMDILRYGPDVEVLAPENLRSRVSERLCRAAAQYSS